MGSYPFFEERYGTNLVLRSTETDTLDTACDALLDALRAAGMALD